MNSVNESLDEYLSSQDEFERNLAAYTRMVNRISEHGINFLGTDGATVNFEKNGIKFGHALMTWQCAADPERPGITEDMVVEWVINAFEKQNNKI
jgi:hypothetical protein